jgi:cation:H+ antiporter
MFLYVVTVILGFVAVIWSADRFVFGAASLARNLGVPPLIIGLTIVGFGTSAPEILVTGIAAWEGNPALGIGNAIGSNITNIGLVIGTTALVMPLLVTSDTLRREFPILFAITTIALAMMMDGKFDRADGVVLLFGFILMIYWMLRVALRSRRSDPMVEEFRDAVPSNVTPMASLGWLIAGLLVLMASSRAVVWGAVEIARVLQVSDLVIGLTIVAIGTSLPELATSVTSALKKEHDIAVGNILGSNMFNTLAVLSLPGLIAPGATDPALLQRDLPAMVGATVLLFAMSYGFGQPGRITRWKGGVLLALFVVYQLVLYLSQPTA